MNTDKEKTESFPSRVLSRRCTTCFRVIQNEPYALCIHCKGFIQCLQCLNEGIEKGQHIREHPFIIAEPKMKPVFRSDWSLEEEMQFLDALESCGIGNFSDMEDILTFKTKQDYEAHFRSVYLGSMKAPIPELYVDMPDEPVCLPDYPTSPTESYPAEGHEYNLAKKRKTEPTTPGEKANYMPLRGEFEKEYWDGADAIACEIDFDDEEDTPETFKAKLDKLVMYDKILQFREMRTNVAIDFDMSEKEYTMPQAPTTELNNITQMLMQLAPYFGKKSILELTDLISKKLDKQTLVETRKKWLANGIQSMDEGFLFSQFEQIINKPQITQEDTRKWKKLFDDLTHNNNNSSLPETDLLSDRELELCRYLDIPSQLYMAYKDLILREFALRGALTREECVKLDPGNEQTLDQIYDYFISVGWICA